MKVSLLILTFAFSLLGCRHQVVVPEIPTGSNPTVPASSNDCHITPKNFSEKASTFSGVINVTHSPYSVVPNASESSTDSSDHSEFIQRAIDDASSHGPFSYTKSPTGRPQAVVYLPEGNYRLANILLKNNVRLEISAGARIFQAKGAGLKKSGLSEDYAIERASIFILDAPVSGRQPLSNVSIVGVGLSSENKRQVQCGWSIDGSFQINVDTTVGGASQTTPIHLGYVSGALLKNIVTIQNNSNSNCDQVSSDPNNYHPAIIFKANTKAPSGSGLYYDAQSVTYTNHYHFGGVRGGGANQIQSGHSFTIESIFSEGGDALRIESDNLGDNIYKMLSKKGQPLCCMSKEGCSTSIEAARCTCSNKKICDPYKQPNLAGNYNSEVKGIIAENIGAKNCNAAIALIPHEQKNKDISIGGVQAFGCATGIALGGGSLPGLTAGAVENATIYDVKIYSGISAQLPSTKCDNCWIKGLSANPIATMSMPNWTANIQSCSAQGPWSSSDSDAPLCQ